MRNKILYLILIFSMALGACTPTSTQSTQAIVPTTTATPENVTPATQEEATATPQQPSEQVIGQLNEALGGRTPPAEAISACDGKKVQDSCEFNSQKGTETGVCEMVQSQLACSPKRGPDTQVMPESKEGQAADMKPESGNAAYNIEQAISDKAQGMTIAFDALAFLTGDRGADSFFPPGKVADFWGFQYLRDNDSSQMGHAGDFLTSAALNMLYILTPEQRGQLIELAKNQVPSINEYGYRRFVLIDAFRRLLENDLPARATELSEEAVKAYSADLYRLDGEISYARAQLMGSLLYNMDATQKAYLDAMVGKGMLEWPKVDEPADIQGLDRDIKVAVMTYAGDMFSWYAGSMEADVYFCPERHGTYYGSFYLKDIPAMSDPTYAIPTDLTGDMGDAMLAVLSPDQALTITSLVDIQKPSLEGIVDVRKQISRELRKFLVGETVEKTTILSLMELYGQLDGEINYQLATNFTKVGQTLTDEQKNQLTAFREEMLGELMHPTGAYLYSQPIYMPDILNTDFLFK